MYPTKRYSTAAMLLIFAATWVSPAWPVEQAFHSSLTLVGFIGLWCFSKPLHLNNRDFLLVAIFLAVHSIAARLLYSYVPYEAWGQNLFRFSINEHLGWSRNNFDRLVHFLFGVCFTPGTVSYLMLKYRLRPRLAFYVAISGVMIVSLWYEWFELAVALTMSVEDAESYNGQQGDVWDAHKDMLMATLGSLAWAWSYRGMGSEVGKRAGV